MTFEALKFSAINIRARLKNQSEGDINYVAHANHEYSRESGWELFSILNRYELPVDSHRHSSFLLRETRQIPRILERVVLDPAFV